VAVLKDLLQGTIYTFGFWLAVLFAALILLLVLIWVLVKVVGKNEEANNTDLVYKSLQDARQNLREDDEVALACVKSGAIFFRENQSPLAFFG
jgi:di/tricarboxylate transporter